MKNTILFSLLTIFLVSCDYYYDDYYVDEPTDFSKDISYKQNFYFETPVALSILNSKIENDTAYYNVGDTLKLSLKLNNLYKANATETYNLYKSTNDMSFNFSLYKGIEIDEKIINLNIFDKYPELSSGEVTEEEIATSPYYTDLYFRAGNITASLNTDTNFYEAKIGLILKKATGLNSENKRIPLQLYTSKYITNGDGSNDYYYYDDYTRAETIYLYIPIFSILNKNVIYIDN